MPTRAIDRLRGANQNRWPHIAAAEVTSHEKMADLSRLANGLLSTDETALVVFGSLARGEFTAGSDLDWTVLIDGRADTGHLEIVHQLKQKLTGARFIEPGPTETFGGLVFSHDLIHAIGGDEDTNKNMTRRLLLLLESAPVAVGPSESVRDRILQGILHRYVWEDAGFLKPDDQTKKIPRFLLNDVVRFWRTMAVDYANKYRARAGKKWALRNIKLRMSRKLLFVSGLFMCLSWKLTPYEPIDQKLLTEKLVAHLQTWTERAPLESLATIIEQYSPSLATDIFDSYDSFLQMLDDDRKRNALEDLAPEKAYNDDVFREARSFSKKFDDALTNLLFESNDDVSQLVKRYGVF
ncbi:MAG: nucleotidyltransferase domain-containing protein [Xanthobacteraceae bacterium]